MEDIKCVLIVKNLGIWERDQNKDKCEMRSSSKQTNVTGFVICIGCRH